MKKFSKNNSGKGTKGFYTALGISAVMIGSACWFAYSEGEKLSDEQLNANNRSSMISEEAVDKKYTNIPKATSPVYTIPVHTTTAVLQVTTAAPETTVHVATIPAAAITVEDPPTEVTAVIPEQVSEATADTLTDVRIPIADISNVINPFSGTELIKNETTGSWQTHNGTDFAAEPGTEVLAVSTGEVTAVNDDPLWGTTVIIDHHNGYISKYCGLAKELSVQAGDTVNSGDVLGVTGDTADIESALPSHLHIEITHNGSYIDPVSIFNS